jgi:peptidoglycan/xylan/chitin deacetylase (PgdA/CDA1 family)
MMLGHRLHCSLSDPQRTKTVFSPQKLAGGPQAALPILMYHRVLDGADPLQRGIHQAKVMDTQFRTLRQFFKVMPLDEAAEMLMAGRLPPRAMCITFDDGYRDNHDLALPLLQRHGLTATFYIASGYLNGGMIFHDVLVEAIRHAPAGLLDLSVDGVEPVLITDDTSRIHAVQQIIGSMKYLPSQQRQRTSERLIDALGRNAPRSLMMTDEQVRSISRAGMGIGGHTTHHVILSGMSSEAARDEIASNKSKLSRLIDKPLTSFAYPNGKPGIDYHDDHTNMVKALGFRNAVSTRSAVGTQQANIFELPRFVLNETTQIGVVLRMLRMTAYAI